MVVVDERFASIVGCGGFRREVIAVEDAQQKPLRAAVMPLITRLYHLSAEIAMRIPWASRRE